jgi:hypothetical protein
MRKTVHFFTKKGGITMNLRRCMWSFCVVMLMTIGHPLTARAMTLEVYPAYQSVALGTNAQVDVWLRSPGGKLLSTYDISLAFDPSILAYSTTTFSSALGDPSDPFSTFSTLPGTGSIEITAFPLIFDSLLQNGTDDLLLFSLNFSTLTVGTSALNFLTDPLYLGDENGGPLQASLAPGSIDVTQSTTPVPEPGTMLLLGTGLLFGVIFMKRKTNHVA